MTTAYLPYPAGFGRQDVLSRGTTGLIVLDRRTRTVIRWPENDDHWQGIQRERAVYEELDELGGHEGLLVCHGNVDTYGLRLEYAAKGDLQSRIRYKGINQPLELQWIIQIARVLEFLHRVGVIHGSVALRHVMLDEEDNATLGDLAWCSMKSNYLLARSAASHEYPGDRLTVQGDLFAFGSAMYELVTGMEPFVTLRDEDIRARFRSGVFPDVAALGALGAIISKCWTAAYENTKDVVIALEG